MSKCVSPKVGLKLILYMTIRRQKPGATKRIDGCRKAVVSCSFYPNSGADAASIAQASAAASPNFPFPFHNLR